MGATGVPLLALLFSSVLETLRNFLWACFTLTYAALLMDLFRSLTIEIDARQLRRQFVHDVMLLLPRALAGRTVPGILHVLIEPREHLMQRVTNRLARDIIM